MILSTSTRSKCEKIVEQLLQDKKEDRINTTMNQLNNQGDNTNYSLYMMLYYFSM